MSFQKSRVLITGANGFVGARLCRRFIERGYEVVAGVRETSDLSQLAGLDVRYRYGDITRPESLPNMVEGVAYVIHNAGIVKARRTEEFFRVNRQGTANLLRAIEEHNPSIKRLVYISSLAAAGPSSGEPARESDPPKPVTTYGESKLAGEREVLGFKEKISSVILRPAGVYGPGDREILTFFKSVNNRILPFIGNVERRIQLVHVDDLCRAVLRAVEVDLNSGEIFFVGENRSYSMRELVTELKEASGKRGIPLYVPGWLFRFIAFVSQWLFALAGATPMLTAEKAGELLASWEVSIAKAREVIGFESEIPFRAGATETFGWYRKEGWL